MSQVANCPRKPLCLPRPSKRHTYALRPPAFVSSLARDTGLLSLVVDNGSVHLRRCGKGDGPVCTRHIPLAVVAKCGILLHTRALWLTTPQKSTRSTPAADQTGSANVPLDRRTMPILILTLATMLA
jgi:hypothetical protein